MFLGGSNARYVSRNLVQQSSQFIGISRSGACIEDVAELLDEDAGKYAQSAQTYVVELGTNNPLMDDKDKILEKYRRMIEELKQRRRRIVILGIMPRTDVSSVIDDKRLEINAALSRLCRAEEVEFLDV